MAWSGRPKFFVRKKGKDFQGKEKKTGASAGGGRGASV